MGKNTTFLQQQIHQFIFKELQFATNNAIG
jgi:hypothetical protein